MLPLRVPAVAVRELVIELDVAGQPDADVGPFNQVMAQKALVGEASGKHTIERPHVIDPFSVIRAFTGEVLVDIGNRAGVGIDAPCIREQAAKEGGARAGQGRADARLDDRVGAGRHPSRLVEPRLVERMGQGLDHAAGGTRRELGVAVQRDHEPDIAQGGQGRRPGPGSRIPRIVSPQ